MILRQRQPRIVSKPHRVFIASLPCLISGKTESVECCHIRYHDAKYGKINPGVGRKPDDKFTVPLTSYWHRLGPQAQHSMSERKFWENHKIDPIPIALALWEVSGDHEAALRIINEARASTPLD